MNRYPIQPKPKRWNAKPSRFWVRRFRSIRRRKREREQNLYAVEVRGIEHVRQANEQNAGILITPNHPGHADAYVMHEAVDQLGYPFYFMSAWQIFEVLSKIGQWSLQIHGCFSVDREGADRQAFRTAIDILQHGRYPLVVFPEGEVYHQNDRVTPFREGAAAIAISAAKKSDRPIVVIPCGIKYRYTEDPTPNLLCIMSRLEEKILWRPKRHLSLKERVYQFAEGILSLKETEYFNSPVPGPLPDRVENLADRILSQLEQRYDLNQSQQHDRRTIPDRVKVVRQAALKRLNELETEITGETGSVHDWAVTPEQKTALEAVAHDLDDVFMIVQAFSYPGDYLVENPTIERLAETIDKFEEDILGASTASIHAPRRAVVSFGQPIPIQPKNRKEHPAQPPTANDLTHTLEEKVQQLLDEIE